MVTGAYFADTKEAAVYVFAVTAVPLTGKRDSDARRDLPR
jgi:hypothetical protein